jgi:hypothetical protein
MKRFPLSSVQEPVPLPLVHHLWHQRGGLSLEESIIRYNLVDHQNYKLVNTNLKEVNTILQIDENCNIRLVS